MKDKNPLLIDRRLANLFLPENISIFINPKEINYIKVNLVKLQLKNNEDKKYVEKADSEEIVAYETTVFTKNSSRDRFVFYAEKPNFDWLKKNAERCGLSLFFRNQDNECIYINKDNIIDMRFERLMEKVMLEEGKEPILQHFGILNLFFTCPQKIEEKQKAQENNESYDFIVLTTKIAIEENMIGWKDYDIVFEYLNKF